jgi:two-component system, chemotaxis family, chemotaxis protein CheY
VTIATGGSAIDVLLVDDDRDIRDTIEQILEEDGYRVATAVDGEDALQRLDAEPQLPRLILLDLMMPVMDGREFLARFTKEPRWAQIPVVIISSGRNAEREAASLSVAGYLAKPIELDLLLSCVRRWVVR